VLAAIADQGLFTGTTFAVNLLLARWLTVAQYGAFAAVYALFVLVVAAYNAIVVEPMLVFGAGSYRERFRGYLGTILAGHVVTVVTASVVLASVGVGVRYAVAFDGSAFDAVGAAVIGASFALPSVLAMWTLRRACYVQKRPALAAVGSGAYLVIALGILWAVATYRGLTALTGFLAIGAAGIVSGAILVMVVKPTTAADARPAGRRVLAQEHWDYGKWLLLTSGFAWVQANVYYLVLPGVAGLAGVASLRATANVLTPWYQSVVAVSTLLVPHFTTLATDRGIDALRQSTARLILIYTGAWAVLWIVLLWIQQPLLHAFYGGRYGELGSGQLMLMAVTPLPLGIGYIVSAAVRALRLPQMIFRSYTVSTALTLTLGAVLVMTHGVSGAIVGGLIAGSAGSTYLAWFLFRRAPRR
jgi:O-antigen/teichoic acid export membrane protein